MKRLRRFLVIAAILAAGAPSAALGLYRPSRVVLPELVSGVACYQGGAVCTDAPERLAEAEGLYAAAFARDTAVVGPFRSTPRVVFCSTDACARSFGVHKNAGLTIGALGSIIAPRAWRTFYVAHELIHQRQAEEFGMVAMHSKPSWLIEGMAYALSGDPRRPLPGQEEAWRARFEAWNTPPHGAGIWRAARTIP